MKSMLRDRFILTLVFGVAVAVIAADHVVAKRLPIKPTGTVAALTLAVAPATVVGGNQATATITLSAPAATNLEITLKSLNNDVAQFGEHFQAIGTSQLTIPKGNIQATYPVHTFGVLASTNVTLQATSGGDTAQTTLTVTPAAVKTLVIAPAKLIGGTGATGTVTLDGLAPPSSGVAVPLSLSPVREAAPRTGTSGLSQAQIPIHPGDSPVSIPATVNVPAGGSSTTFTISTTPVAADVLMQIVAGFKAGSAQVPGFTDGTSNTLQFGSSTSSAAATLTILAPNVSALSLSPASVPGGSGVIGTVVLTAPAPSGGLPISFSAGSSTDVTLPPAVSVPGGTDRTTFKIMTQPSTVPHSATIVAATQANVKQIALLPHLEDGSVRNAGGTPTDTVIVGTSVSATLSITPTPPPFTISVQPTQVVGGSPVAITIGIQPTSTTVPGSISLSSNHPELLLLPATASMSGGNTFSVSPSPVNVNANTLFATADQTVTITATGGSTSASTPLLIKQTPPIASFILRGTTVTGGQNIIGQILLVNNATAPVTVTFTTNYPQFVTVPATITISNSPVPTPLNFRTSTPTGSMNISITASTGGQTITQTITLVP
jgi:hypothetical protein